MTAGGGWTATIGHLALAVSDEEHQGPLIREVRTPSPY